MTGYRRPPVRALKVVIALLGATALGAAGRGHFGRPGLVAGIVLGVGAGWVAGWWVARELFED